MTLSMGVAQPPLCAAVVPGRREVRQNRTPRLSALFLRIFSATATQAMCKSKAV
eukprot:SAG11_NODE_19715_length_460_cov_1.146814_1_plen_53_part_10